ncbi:MAG: DUF4837 family protein [Bacteroidales bacterium]|nr:DUF4837 family protein [Bacteroidales bacterium]
MRKISEILLGCGLIILSACGDGTNGVTEKFMPECYGKTGDVLLVMNDDSYNGFVGDTVFNWLTQPVIILPQNEQTFNVIHIKPSAYSDILKKARNVIYADINPKNEKSTFSLERDKHARPQIFITIKAKNDSAFYDAWLKSEKFIYDTLIVAEKARYLTSYFNKYHDAVAESELQKNHKFKINVPKGFIVDVDKEHFVWMSKETSISSQGILIFDCQYDGAKSFIDQKLLSVIDSTLMLNVPGPADGSYMTISKYYPPFQKTYMRDKNYVSELRGLWETEGDFMGGPFVSHSLVDTISGRLYTVFGYVYGGKKDKKLLMWQVESIMSTFKFDYKDGKKED